MHASFFRDARPGGAEPQKHSSRGKERIEPCQNMESYQSLGIMAGRSISSCRIARCNLIFSLTPRLCRQLNIQSVPKIAGQPSQTHRSLASRSLLSLPNSGVQIKIVRKKLRTAQKILSELQSIALMFRSPLACPQAPSMSCSGAVRKLNVFARISPIISFFPPNGAISSTR